MSNAADAKPDNSTPPINSKKVLNRRLVRYSNLDDFLNDAEQHSGADTVQLGNWTPGQVFEHLAKTINCSIDGFQKVIPAPVRWVLSLFFKRKFLTKGVPPGFKAPTEFVPSDISNHEGLELLRNSISRFSTEKTRALHPGLGKITDQEWQMFHLRHAELHMSFLTAK